MSAGIRRLLMCSSSAAALRAAMSVRPVGAEPDGWYGAVDAGYRTYGYSS